MIIFFVIYQDQIETDVNLYFIEFIFKGENVIWQRGANMILAMFHIGAIHKPCGHDRGRGVYQMSILLHKPY